MANPRTADYPLTLTAPKGSNNTTDKTPSAPDTRATTPPHDGWTPLGPILWAHTSRGCAALTRGYRVVRPLRGRQPHHQLRSGTGDSEARGDMRTRSAADSEAQGDMRLRSATGIEAQEVMRLRSVAGDEAQEVMRLRSAAGDEARGGMQTRSVADTETQGGMRPYKGRTNL